MPESKDEQSVVAYRLFRKEEIEGLKEFLLKQKELQKQFPDYKKWIKKVIPQIISLVERKNEITNWRLAFGLIKGIPVADSSLNRKIIGSALLNLSTSNFVELKSFFICPEDRDHFYSRKLFDIVHNHCAKHGIRKIETSILSSDVRTISAFLRHGYKFINEEDVYLIGQPRIRMKKELLPFFDGDPFDWEQICVWFIKNFFKTDEIKKSGEVLDFKLALSDISKSDIPADEEGSCFKLNIKCRAYMLKQCKVNDLKRYIKESKRDKNALTFFLIKSVDSTIEGYLNKEKIIYFDEQKVCYESGKIELPTYLKKEIGGMIVELKEKYYNEIKNKRNFIYFKGARIGHNLRKGKVIFFFVLPSKNEIKGEIMGYGFLKEKPSIGAPNEEWTNNNGNVLLPKEEFEEFAQNKERIMSMKIKNYRHITPIKSPILNNLLNSNLEPEDLHQLYLNKETTSKIIGLTNNVIKGGNGYIKDIIIFFEHCKTRCYSAFWTKRKELKEEPENIAKDLLTTSLLDRYYTYSELKVGNGYVDILARDKEEKNKHFLIELKINNGSSYLEKGLGRLRDYIDDTRTYNLEKTVYYLIFDFTKNNTAKKHHNKRIKYKKNDIKILVISLPKK